MKLRRARGLIAGLTVLALLTPSSVQATSGMQKLVWLELDAKGGYTHLFISGSEGAGRVSGGSVGAQLSLTLLILSLTMDYAHIFPDADLFYPGLGLRFPVSMGQGLELFLSLSLGGLVLSAEAEDLGGPDDGRVTEGGFHTRGTVEIEYPLSRYFAVGVMLGAGMNYIQGAPGGWLSALGYVELGDRGVREGSP